MIARIGSMISPFIASGLSKKAYWLPPVIFGIIPLLGALLVLFLPGEI
jgi:zinc transporter ZupT